MTNQQTLHDSPDIPAHLLDEWESRERRLALDSDEPWQFADLSWEGWLDHLARKYLTPRAYAEWRHERNIFLSTCAGDDANRNMVAWGIA